MTVKHEQNLVGSLMFVIFLMGSVIRYFWEALSCIIGKGSKRDYVEMFLMFPLSLGMIGFLVWVFFDSSWLNFDDEDKEMEWKTSRWIKFLILFTLPLAKLFTASTETTDYNVWGLVLAHQIKQFLVIFTAYLSLCSAYRSGLGRLFQPFTVPRSKIYTDEKGQKFEVNFIGTTLAIILIVAPCWMASDVSIGRLLLFLSGNSNKIANSTSAGAGLFPTAQGRAFADVLILLFCFYSFTVTFYSCSKVTFFLKNNNYLKFAPIPLTPLTILFSDQLCSFGVDKAYGATQWIQMLCYVLVSFVAYMSLVSPPDSLTAILFQPHVPMINIVEDLPDIKQPERPRTAVVFPAESKKAEESTKTEN